MPTSASPTIVNVGYRSTNYWVVSAGRSRLLVDLGFPGTMGLMRANLDRMGIPLGEIRFGLATHYHLDHAGLTQELKSAGVPLLVCDLQVPFISRMKEHIKPADHFVDITLHDNTQITCAESRPLLERLGIAGELIHTPGHSDDSISLLLDDGAVFTGDLTHPLFVTEAEAAVTLSSWQTLRDRGATTVYAGHGPVRTITADSL